MDQPHAIYMHITANSLGSIVINSVKYESIRLKFGKSLKLVSVIIVYREIRGKYHFCTFQQG